MTVDGFNMFSSTSSASAGAIWIKLKHLKDRGDVKKIDDIIGQFQAKLAEDKRANFLVLNMPTVDGFGNTSGMELVLQDRTNGELQKLGQVSYEMMGALMQRPEIAVAFTTFDVSFPQFELLVDEAKAAQLGVSLADVMGVMQDITVVFSHPTSTDLENTTEYRYNLHSMPEKINDHWMVFL